MRAKISVIGAGNVGATTAFALAERELADVVLLDVVEDLPQGKGLDMMEARYLMRSDVTITGTNSYEDIAGSKLVIVTAGLPRKPGMSRLDLLKKNASITKSVAENIAKYAPDAMVLMVANPLDVMTYYLRKITGFPANRVFGQAGVLDSARFVCFIAMELGVSIKDISPMVLGGHGDSMVPLPRYTTVSGVSVTELINKEKLDAMVQRTRKAGGEIVALLKTGSAFYAPAIATVAMAESVIKDQKRIMPTSCFLSGQYGIDDVYCGVPAKLGAGGVEEVIELDLTDDELEALRNSASIYKKSIEQL